MLEKLPLPAAQVVKAAYARIGIDSRLTPALLLRATIAESAGQHPYSVLVRACVESLERKQAAVRGIRDRMAARQYATTRTALWYERAQGAQPTVSAPAPAVPPSQATLTLPAPAARSRRGARR